MGDAIFASVIQSHKGLCGLISDDELLENPNYFASLEFDFLQQFFLVLIVFGIQGFHFHPKTPPSLLKGFLIGYTILFYLKQTPAPLNNNDIHYFHQ